jgi:hypothetical protein
MTTCWLLEYRTWKHATMSSLTSRTCFRFNSSSTIACSHRAFLTPLTCSLALPGKPPWSHKYMDIHVGGDSTPHWPTNFVKRYIANWTGSRSWTKNPFFNRQQHPITLWRIRSRRTGVAFIGFLYSPTVSWQGFKMTMLRVIVNRASPKCKPVSTLSAWNHVGNVMILRFLY